MKTIFDCEWITNNTNEETTVTFIFEVDRANYQDECEIQTLYYDQIQQIFIATNDYGVVIHLPSWEDFEQMLHVYGVIRLVESSVNDTNSGIRMKLHRE